MKKYCYLLLLTSFISCRSEKMPSKPADMSDRKYGQYYKMLIDAKVKNDYFWQGVALSNLGESPKKVYKLLHKSTKQHDTICYQIHEYQEMHRTGALTVNMIKIDTIRWKKLCEACEKIVNIDQYYLKKQERILAYKKERAIAESKLDTNLIDKKLVALLKEIMKKDKAIRGIPFMNSQNKRWKEQKLLDSLNLIQVDSIFRVENGYPSVEKVGLAAPTPWFVLHHQSSVETRKKYLPYLEEAVRNGYLTKSMLETYNERTLTIEERGKGKKEKPVRP